MGNFSGKPYEGQRAGASNRKISKEMVHDRLKHESPERQSIADRKGRLKQLQSAISQERNPMRLEPLYEQFANAVASFPPTVFVPDEISRIEKASSLDNDERLSSLKDSNYQGEVQDFLPLHHLVKLLAREVFQPGKNSLQKDQYIYILGVQKLLVDTEDLPAINRKSLEAFLLTFSNRIRPGLSFELKVSGKTVQIPYSADPYVSDHNSSLTSIRRNLSTRQVWPNEQYILGRISDGRKKIDTRLNLRTEKRQYRDDIGVVPVVVSYVSLKKDAL